jgi:hypothetical protein
VTTPGLVRYSLGVQREARRPVAGVRGRSAGCAAPGRSGHPLFASGRLGDGEQGVGDHRERDVGVPGPPGPGLGLVEPADVFGLLEALLDLPPCSGDPGQVGQAGPAGPVGDVVGDLRRVRDRTAGEEPVASARSPGPADRHPCPVVAARPMRAGPDTKPLPSRSREALRSSRCIPSGQLSPACSAIHHEFLRCNPDTRSRGSDLANLGPIRPISSSNSALQRARFTFSMTGERASLAIGNAKCRSSTKPPACSEPPASTPAPRTGGERTGHWALPDHDPGNDRRPRRPARRRRARPAHPHRDRNLIAPLVLTVRHIAAQLLAWSRWRPWGRERARASRGSGTASAGIQVTLRNAGAGGVGVPCRLEGRIAVPGARALRLLQFRVATSRSPSWEQVATSESSV